LLEPTRQDRVLLTELRVGAALDRVFALSSICGGWRKVALNSGLSHESILNVNLGPHGPILSANGERCRLGDVDEELVDALATDVCLAAGGDDAMAVERERRATTIGPDLATARDRLRRERRAELSADESLRKMARGAE